ncbi:hypothetical protein MHI43_31905 [Paenibacillus sp. FSL H8-0457]|uniref:hypothetical protein n=1 Tax=unclassified Paenibacillus TaxID=185978 RepID=UPI000178922C|nr:MULTISPECIES: hypothetical protein [unclassified Paenibacillus]ACX68502.1 hypothetical protein GYMC10_6299 [Paenibacillus sp. Y412MC10]ETT69433.1 hypothetical protein C172_02060 [Paenibacillus sp. FSL H8-457]
MKWMKWLLKISLTAILVSTLTIVTTGIVVNAYIQSVLSSFNIQLEAEPMGVGGIMKSMLGVGSGTKPDAGSVNAAKGNRQLEEDQGAADDVSEAGTETNGGAKEDEETSSGSTGTSGETSNDEEAPDNSLPVMGTNTTESGDSSLEDQEIVMTPGDIVDRKDRLPTEEKEEIFTMLMNKLPQSEMQKISEAMEDGLTAAELAEIEQGISKYLNPEEFDKLITMLKE